jgi:hypothetical protein
MIKDKMNKDSLEMISDVIESLEDKNLSYRVLEKGSDEEKLLSEWIEKNFPWKKWGRIDWRNVSNSKCIEWYSWEDECLAFSKIIERLNESNNTTVYIIWFSALRPVLELKFETFNSVGHEILDADSDVWILCPSRGWCIENYHENEICFGYIVNHQ